MEMVRSGCGGQRGVTLFEVALVATIAAVLVLAVVAGRSVVEMSRENALVRIVGTVQASFRSFTEARHRLPGDANNDGTIDPFGENPKAIEEMRDEGYLDPAVTEGTPPSVRLVLPYGLRASSIGTQVGVTILAPNITIRIPTNSTSLQQRVDAILDDGMTTTGNVRVDTGADPDVIHIVIP